MGAGRNTVARRLTAIVATVVLASFAWAGSALAQPVDPLDTASSVVAPPSGTSSSSQESSAAAADGSTTTSSPAVTQTDEAEPGGTVRPNALLGLPLGSGLAVPSTFPAFPTGTGIPTIPGLPAISPGTDPVTACSQVVSSLRGLDPTDLSAALDAPASIFCSSLCFELPSLPGLPGLPGGDQSATGVTETVYAPPDFYDDGYGRRYYSSCGCDDAVTGTDTATPVAATQVSSVPSGGVDTGDGSYEGP